MKIYPLLFATFILLAWAEGERQTSISIEQSYQSFKSFEGLYEKDHPSNIYVNDSIRIFSDSITVYKDPGFGYGRIISFNYKFTELDSNKLVLSAFAMDPRGMFVLPGQYEWHQDTLELKFPENESPLLIGPEKEIYKLNSAKSKRH